ncbi:MAG: outer membrane lipoprotein-sorting protein [Gallionella sp.]|nr:outer membrane lipoprotein-sorting protein [Gallionella sp.]MDD4946388.1 outer membrane lipoprotein-sorting protein [Gallionella sp.]MDD5612815.1 outer membrane lipoprotein-sorting protein [Gallionella sp.]
MMKRIAALLMLCASGIAAAGEPALSQAAPTAKEMAGQMRQAQRSAGFMVRMNVAATAADGRHLVPFKLAVIGQNEADRQRLLVRGIAPEAVRDRQFAVQRNTAGGIRAFGYGGKDKPDAEISPQARLFDSGMTLWDMLSPWWDWPAQKLTGAGQVGGKACTLIESLAPKGDPAISRVVSCVALDSGLVLQTEVYDGRNKLLRTLTVKATMRRESGALAAKRLTLSEADHARSEIEIYSGDENYQAGAETFSKLDALCAVPQPR